MLGIVLIEILRLCCCPAVDSSPRLRATVHLSGLKNAFLGQNLVLLQRTFAMSQGFKPLAGYATDAKFSISSTLFVSNESNYGISQCSD